MNREELCAFEIRKDDDEGLHGSITVWPVVSACNDSHGATEAELAFICWYGRHVLARLTATLAEELVENRGEHHCAGKYYDGLPDVCEAHYWEETPPSPPEACVWFHVPPDQTREWLDRISRLLGEITADDAKHIVLPCAECGDVISPPTTCSTCRRRHVRGIA